MIYLDSWIRCWNVSARRRGLPNYLRERERERERESRDNSCPRIFININRIDTSFPSEWLPFVSLIGEFSVKTCHINARSNIGLCQPLMILCHEQQVISIHHSISTFQRVGCVVVRDLRQPDCGFLFIYAKATSIDVFFCNWLIVTWRSELHNNLVRLSWDKRFQPEIIRLNLKVDQRSTTFVLGANCTVSIWSSSKVIFIWEILPVIYSYLEN